MHLLLSLFLAAAPPDAGRPAPPPGSELRCVEVLAALRRGDFPGATAHFDEAMRRALSPKALGSAWERIGAQAGPLSGFRLVRLSSEGAIDVCEYQLDFARGPLRSTIAVRRESHEVAGLWFRPPEAPLSESPLPPGVRSEEVRFGREPWVLGGTLTAPARPGRFAAVLLVGGSGPVDRNESAPPNAPFRDLAQGLSARDIVVLRYDKRTLSHAIRLRGRPLTVEDEVLADALSALRWLRTRPEVDPARMVVVGHSLGALLTPEIAQRDGKLARAVLLAPPARPLPELILAQLRARKTLSPEQDAQMEAQVRKLETGKMAPDETFLEVPVSYWTDLDRRDELGIARALRIPLLVLRGEEDVQVGDVDQQRWAVALRGHPRARVETLPGLDHFFLPAAESAAGKAVPFDAGALAQIAAFVEAAGKGDRLLFQQSLGAHPSEK